MTDRPISTGTRATHQGQETRSPLKTEYICPDRLLVDQLFPCSQTADHTFPGICPRSRFSATCCRYKSLRRCRRAQLACCRQLTLLSSPNFAEIQSKRSACQWVCAKAVIAEPKGCRRHIAKVAASPLFVGEPFYRPKTGHPVDHCAEREGHVAHLNMILGLLRAREQARSQ
jgi:hypothetical protein